MNLGSTVHKMEQDIHIHSLYGVKMSATRLFIINRVSPKKETKIGFEELVFQTSIGLFNKIDKNQ